MRITVFLALVVLIAVAPDAVTGACQAAVSAALSALSALLDSAATPA